MFFRKQQKPASTESIEAEPTQPPVQISESKPDCGTKTQKIDRSDLDFEAELSKTQRIDLRSNAFSLIAADSHPGFVRRQNEDSYGYLLSEHRKCALLAAADGIGGNLHGDVASTYSMKLLLSAWRQFLTDHVPNVENTEQFLRDTLERINAEVYEINIACEATVLMGTTIVVLVLFEHNFITAHAGDSRVYRIRKDMITRMTEDHSYISKMVRSGKLTSEEAASHPLSHVILKSLGTTSHLKPELHVFERLPGDKFVVCTDGLNLHLKDSEIYFTVKDSDSATMAVRKLLNAVLREGGGDNVSILCSF